MLRTWRAFSLRPSISIQSFYYPIFFWKARWCATRNFLLKHITKNPKSRWKVPLAIEWYFYNSFFSSYHNKRFLLDRLLSSCLSSSFLNDFDESEVVNFLFPEKIKAAKRNKPSSPFVQSQSRKKRKVATSYCWIIHRIVKATTTRTELSRQKLKASNINLCNKIIISVTAAAENSLRNCRKIMKVEVSVSKYSRSVILMTCYVYFCIKRGAVRKLLNLEPDSVWFVLKHSRVCQSLVAFY